MTEIIVETLAERPDLVEKIARKSIGRDLKVESWTWTIRGPIERIVVNGGQHNRYLYFYLKWIAEETDDNRWELIKPDLEYGNKVAIASLDEIYPMMDENGTLHLIAPGSMHHGQIHPEGVNLKKEDLKSPLPQF